MGSAIARRFSSASSLVASCLQQNSGTFDSRGTARREHAKRLTPLMRRRVAVSLDSPIDSLRVNGVASQCQYPRIKTAQRDIYRFPSPTGRRWREAPDEGRVIYRRRYKARPSPQPLPTGEGLNAPRRKMWGYLSLRPLFPCRNLLGCGVSRMRAPSYEDHVMRMEPLLLLVFAVSAFAIR